MMASSSSSSSSSSSTDSVRRKLAIGNVNRMDFYEFQDTFGNVMENSRFCAASVWSFRPFRDVRQLHEAFCHFVDRLPTAGRQGLLRGFPDLAVKLSAVNELTPESASEQRLAGLLDVTDDQRRRIADLNADYKSRFGFPFVICARLNRVDAIVAALESRLQNPVDDLSQSSSELHVAIEQAKQICRLRLLDLVDDVQTQDQDQDQDQDRVRFRLQTGSNL